MAFCRVKLNPKTLPKLMGFEEGVRFRSVSVSPEGFLEILLSGPVPDVSGAFVGVKAVVGSDGRIGVVFGPVVAPAPGGG
jgi:hypothetical protein